MSDQHDAGVRKALFAGVVANFGVALVKLVAFYFTRSAAMLAESVHSFADSSNQALLLFGIERSKKPATEAHPFGFTLERYFYSFVVSVNIFMLGAVVAIYEGIQKIRHPHPMDDVIWNYGALGLAALFEAYALSVAWREFKHWREEQAARRVGKPPKGLWQSLVEAKDLSLPTVLFEDTAALLGLTLAAIGVAAADITGNGIYDGIASVSIGAVLLIVAGFLARESHSLLVGEAATEEDRDAIREFVSSDVDVAKLVEMTTLQRGPKSILVALVLEFADELSADDIEAAVLRLENGIRSHVPEAEHIFVEAGALHPKRSA